MPTTNKRKKPPSSDSNVNTLDSYLSTISNARTRADAININKTQALMKTVASFGNVNISKLDQITPHLLQHLWQMDDGILRPAPEGTTADKLIRSMSSGDMYVIPKMIFSSAGELESVDYNDPVVLTIQKHKEALYFQACDAERAGVWKALEPVTEDNKLKVSSSKAVAAPTVLDYILDFFARFFFSRREVCALWDTYSAVRDRIDPHRFKELKQSLPQHTPASPVPQKTKTPVSTKLPKKSVATTGERADRTPGEKKGSLDFSFEYDPAAFGPDIVSTNQNALSSSGKDLFSDVPPHSSGASTDPKEIDKPADEYSHQEPPKNSNIEKLISSIDLNALQNKLSVPPYNAPKESYEFTTNKTLIDAVGTSNDPEVLANYARNNPNLSQRNIKHLDHRVKHLKILQETSANPPQKQVRGSCTREGNKISLNGVTQVRKQDTNNGCWSVSLSSQMAYRGVDLDQQTIRAFRPDSSVQDFIDFNTTSSTMNKDATQSIGDYANLIHRVLPNTAVYSMGCLGNDLSAEDRVAILKHAVKTALQEHNSPVSLVSNFHFITVYGMDDTHLYCKNPMYDREYKIPIQSVADAETGFQAYWLQDMKPTLSGGTTGLYSTMNYNAVGYSAGRMFNGNSPIEGDYQSRQACIMTNVPGCNSPVRLEGLFPDRLHYRRQEGIGPEDFALNLDALEDNLNALRALPNHTSPAIADILNTGEQLLSGQLRANHTGIYQLAQKYCAAVADSKQAMETAEPQNKEALQKQYDLLRNQTDQMRQCLADLLHHKFMPMLGKPHSFFADADQVNERDQMERGMAGMLFINSVNQPTVDDTVWLHMFSPEKYEKQLEDILISDAFRSAMDELQTLARDESSQSINLDERKSVQLKRGLMSQHPKQLWDMYQKGLGKAEKTSQHSHSISLDLDHKDDHKDISSVSFHSTDPMTANK